MPLNKTEQAVIENVIKRLRCEPRKMPDGTVVPRQSDEVRAALSDPDVRVYLDTWVIGVLALLLPGEDRNPELARQLSR